MILFAGMIITKRFIKPYALPIYYSLSIRYAFENMLAAVLEHKGEAGEDVLAYYSMHPGDRHFNYALLGAMYLLWVAFGLWMAKRKITGARFVTIPAALAAANTRPPQVKTMTRRAFDRAARAIEQKNCRRLTHPQQRPVVARPEGYRPATFDGGQLVRGALESRCVLVGTDAIERARPSILLLQTAAPLFK